MSGPPGVLFLCTGNSARSLLAEAILERLGEGRFRAHSAGSRPTGAPNPLALAELRERGHDTSRLRSKSWDEFAGAGAPEIRFVFTVCDNAAGESCPVWPGAPLRAHWGVDDPAAAEGSEEERRAVFRRVYGELEERIRRFVALPFETLDDAELARRLAAIGGE